MVSVPELEHSDGCRIPQIGFGTFELSEGEEEARVAEAVEAGYRMLDTATIYRNEAEVGAAIRNSGIARDQFFVTTKLWNTDQGADRARRAFDQSQEKLGLAEIDLYLIHWPMPSRGLFLETWRVLEELKGEGRVRSLGVSNFRVQDLELLLAHADIPPVLNQIELHPQLVQQELREFHADHGIVTGAWSPLGRALFLDEPVTAAIAADHGKSPAQVVLRWHIQLGNVPIPKTNSAARMAENLDIFDFELTPAEVDSITALNRDHRTGMDPNRVGER